MEVLCADGLDTFNVDMYLVSGNHTLSLKFVSRDQMKTVRMDCTIHFVIVLLVKNTICTNIQDEQSGLPHI